MYLHSNFQILVSLSEKRGLFMSLNWMRLEVRNMLIAVWAPPSMKTRIYLSVFSYYSCYRTHKKPHPTKTLLTHHHVRFRGDQSRIYNYVLKYGPIIFEMQGWYTAYVKDPTSRMGFLLKVAHWQSMTRMRKILDRQCRIYIYVQLKLVNRATGRRLKLK